MMPFCLILCFIVFYGAAVVDGLSKDNETIFAAEGKSATFRAKRPKKDCIVEIRKIEEGKEVSMLKGNIKNNKYTRNFARDNWENRAIEINESNSLKIELRNVSIKDSGTYRLDVNQDSFYFALYIMEIRFAPSTIQKDSVPVNVFAHPKSSLVNVTMVWLFDGKPVNQNAYLFQQGDLILMVGVTKDMVGKNFTYRAVQDDGEIIETNATVKLSDDSEKNSNGSLRELSQDIKSHTTWLSILTALLSIPIIFMIILCYRNRHFCPCLRKKQTTQNNQQNDNGTDESSVPLQGSNNRNGHDKCDENENN